MAITLRFQGGKLAGKVLTFADDVQMIAIGRNPDRCQVVFPPDETHVGREHCSLQRVLGRYRLILNGEDRVFINGKEAYHEEELPAAADMKLGPAGPQLVATTTDQSGLPPTILRGKHQPGMGTELGSVKHESTRGLRIAMMALLALGAASLIGYQLHIRTTDALNHASDEVKKTAPDLPEHLRAASASVYLVVIKTSNGETSEGTAWVVADGVLATNAHIAEVFLKSLGTNAKLVVRSCANPPVDVEVTGAELHPGYRRFDEIVTDRSPATPATDAGYVERLRMPPACDVALLNVATPALLAAALPMATDQEAQAISVGEQIGMIGYPSENITGHNTATPQPSVQTGRIARCTDYLLRTDGGAVTTQLVHHSAPETGGSSGSPIFNAEGKVIAINSAANFANINSTRIPVAVGLNFGQRVDVLRELLEHRATDAQKSRDAQWESELGHYQLNDDEDTVRSNAVASWAQDVAGSHAVEISRQRIELKTNVYGGDYQGSVQIPLANSGSYLFHVYSIGKLGVTTKLFSSPDALLEQISATDMWYTHLNYTAFVAGTVRLDFTSGHNDGPSVVDVVAYRRDATPSILQLLH